MQFLVEPIWSWPAAILTSVGLVVLVLVTYRAQLRRLSGGGARLLLTLRLLSVLVLTFAMFRPALQKSDTDENPVQLLVLSDVSRSMNTADMPGRISRFKAVRADIAKYEPKWKELGKQVDVRQFDFDRDLLPYNPSLTEGGGDQTAFGKVLEDLLRESRDHRSLGLLLLTDGAQRAIPPFDIDPLSAARKLADSQIPIYAVGYGASSLSTASLDVAVEDLRVDPVVFEKKLVPLSCKVRASGANGQKFRVRVLVEDRSGKRNNESGELKQASSTQQATTVKEFQIKKDDETIPVDLSFVPMAAGDLKIAIEVEPLENELLTHNNRRETILSVKKGGVNVAYFDQARPEQRFIKMVNGADKIQLDLQEIRSGKFAVGTKLDPTWFDRGRFDVYIIGDVRAEWFGAGILKKLAARLEDGAGLLMTGGLQNFAPGGYATSPLADFLPVQLDPADYRPPGKINGSAQLPGDVKLVPTERGLKEYVMQLGGADKNRSLWLQLPALAGGSRLRPRNELVRIWAETADKQPLLLVSDVGRARVAAFAADTTWLWCLDGGRADLHQRFWRQMILWLAKKEADADQPVWVQVEPRNYAPGANATLSFGARAVDGSPLGDVEFQVEVTRPDGKIEKPTPRQSNIEHSAEFSSTTEPGDYWVRVTGRRNGETIPYMAYTRFIVDARDLELDYPSADYDFLKELSSMTGGTSLKPEELGSLLERLKENKFGAITRIQVITLWDNWWLLLAFVGLMSAEWFLRKKRGLV
jgi:hypothetical protein